MKVWLYYRLSRDEDEELNSLTNQRKIICEYALANGYELVVENACREPDGFAAALRCREFLQKNFNI